MFYVSNWSTLKHSLMFAMPFYFSFFLLIQVTPCHITFFFNYNESVEFKPVRVMFLSHASQISSLRYIDGDNTNRERDESMLYTHLTWMDCHIHNHSKILYIILKCYKCAHSLCIYCLDKIWHLIVTAYKTYTIQLKHNPISCTLSANYGYNLRMMIIVKWKPTSKDSENLYISEEYKWKCLHLTSCSCLFWT